MRAFRTISNFTALTSIQKYLFCHINKLPLSAEAQRAVWARKIISTIERTQPPQDIFAPSLKEILMDLPDPSPLYDFDKAIKKQMLSFFGEGVELSHSSFCQQRIFRARQASSKSDEKIIFAFCPNFLVTQPMFNLVRPNQFILISGCFGISKTISLVLYSNLLKPINQYYYKAQLAQNKDLLKQIKMLETNSLLRKHSKYWYWTINWNSIQRDGVKSVMDCLIGQAKELSEEEIATLKATDNLKEFIGKLKSYYKEKEISSWVIIDQINEITSFMRKWNEFIFKKGDLLERMSTLQEQQQIVLKEWLQNQQKMNQHPAKQLYKIFDEVKWLGMGYLLNSPINIETSLIQDPYKHANQFPASHTQFRKYPTLMLPLLEKHEEVVRMQIKYRQNLRKKFGKCDFWHYFWFEVERSLLQKSISREKLSIAKRIFLLAASKAQVKGFFRNIYVFDCLQNKPLTSELTKMIEELPTHESIVQTFYSGLDEYFSWEELKQMFPFRHTKDIKDEKSLDEKKKKDHPLQAYFTKYINTFSDFACGKEQQRLVQFLDKGNKQTKKRLLMILYSFAERSAEATSLLSCSFATLDAVLGTKSSQFFTEQENCQGLLPTTSISSRMMQLQWTSNDFMELILKNISATIKKGSRPHSTKTYNNFCATRPSNQASLFQYLLLDLLQPSTTITFPIFRCGGFLNPFLDLDIEIAKRLVNVNRQPNNQTKEKEMIFLESERPLAATSDKVNQAHKESMFDGRQQQLEAPLLNVQQHLQQVMRLCNQNYSKFISVVPDRTSAIARMKQQFILQSQCIDFMLAVKRTDAYEIFTFDIVTESDRLLVKINSARRYLLSLTSSKKNSFKFRHYILCPKQACNSAIPISNTKSIYFVCIDSLKIEHAHHTDRIRIFETLQAINASIRRTRA